MTRTPATATSSPGISRRPRQPSLPQRSGRGVPTGVTHVSATVTLNHRFPDDRGNIPRHDARETPFSDDRGRTVRHDPHVNRCTQGTWQSPTDHIVGIPGFCQRRGFSSNPTVCHDALKTAISGHRGNISCHGHPKTAAITSPWPVIPPPSSANRRTALTVANSPPRFSPRML